MSPLMFLGLGVMVLATLLHIVGLATTHWVDFKAGLLLDNMGLFRKCRGDQCGDIDGGDSKLDACRAFTILGALLAMAAIALGALFVLVKSLQSNKLVPIGILIAGAASCGSIILAVIIFSSEIYNSDFSDYGYSFALCIVGALGIGAGGLLTFLGGRASPS